MAYYDYIGFAGLLAAALSIIVLIWSMLRKSDLANTIPYMAILWFAAIALTSAAAVLQGGC